MTSARRYNGVAHDIAHHAQSSVSGVHPHAVRACRRAGLSSVGIDLLSGTLSDGEDTDGSLASASDALRQKLSAMIGDAGLNPEDLASATLVFVPVAGKDDWSTEVRSSFKLRDGRTFDHVVPITW